MSWPFPDYIRPLMRSVLWYLKRGESMDDIRAILTGPGQRHRAQDVDIAIPEAMRSLYFADQLRAASATETFDSVWQRCAGNCFQLAYGRPPQGQELAWYNEHPGDSLGLMYEITVSGADDFRYTPTVNVPWNAPLGAISELVKGWFITGLPSPPPSRSVGELIERGSEVNVSIIGGALVPRIEPTLTVGRQG